MPATPQSFYRAHTRLLEKLVASSPLPEIFSEIALLIERLSPGKVWCAVLARSSGSATELEVAAAPSIPREFLNELIRLQTTPEGGCGKSFTTGEMLVVENLLEDPACTDFRDLALRSGIRGCWTVPVLSRTGDVLALIVSYYHTPHSPTQEEVGRGEDLRQLASLAIEKCESADELLRSNERFKSVAAATNDAIWDWNIETNTLWWSDGFSKLFGFEGEGSGPCLEEWLERVHPEDRERVWNSLEPDSLGKVSHWRMEYRFARKDGSVAHVVDKAEIFTDAGGRVLRLIGGMTDVTVQKEAQLELTALNRALAMLSSCNQIVIRATEEDQLLTDVCRVVTEVGGYAMAWVGYADEGPLKKIVPVAHTGDENGYLDPIELSYDAGSETGQGPAGRALRTGEAVIYPDISRDATGFFWLEAALSRGFRSIISLPLKVDDHCFGILSLLAKSPNVVSPDERNLLQKLADNLAFGIVAIRARIKQQKTQDAVVRVAQTVTDGDGKRFYDLITRNLVEGLGAISGIVGRINRESQTVTTLSYVLNGELQKNIVYSLKGTPCEVVTMKHVCVFERGVADLFPDDHFLTQKGIEGYAGVALFGKRDKPVGILSVLFDEALIDPSLVRSILQIFAERTASELEREEADARIFEQASLLDKARDAIFTIDLANRIRFWNKSSERLYGWTSEDASGRSAQEILHQDRESFDRAYALTFEYGEWLGVLHQINKHGQSLIVESRWNLVRNSEGEPISILAINTNITEHKKLEQQFLRAQRLESVGTLAGGLAHDLNNVLAPISMSIELLRGSVSDPRGTELLDTIAMSAHRGADMVGQVLSFARGVEGRHVILPGEVLIKGLTPILRDTFPKNIRIQTRIEEDLSPIEGDATQLHQVLLNFCLNARDAMPDGGLLSISSERVDLDDEYAGLNLEAETGPYLCIRVEDTGEGIPQENIGKVFDPFFTTKGVGKGTGLGLSTSLAIIKSHGGFIKAYSEPGRGTAFCCYLPMVEARDEGQTSGEPEVLPQGAGEKILIVDDEEPIRAMTVRIVESFGYRAVSAGSGAEAIEIYRENYGEIAATITDMMMPGLDGPATIKALREINPQARIIAVSGIDANSHLAIAEGQGAQAFLQKPYTTKSILHALQNILRKGANHEA